MRETILVTGATGLIGGGVLQRMLEANPKLRAYVLVRDELRWKRDLGRWGGLASRITAVSGDVRSPGMGMDSGARSRIASEVSAILHAAANTSFSRPLEESRLSNTVGTNDVLELASECRGLRRFAYVSTAFVAGRATGTILERDNGLESGWVNAYEQSKYEAEALVREARGDWVIARAATIVCDAVGGPISQANAVHHTLRLWRRGLVPMLPGGPASRAEVVTLEEVARAIAALALHPDAARTTVHLCAGERALAVGDVIAIAWEVWGCRDSWRRRAIPRPDLVDLGTYRLFEQTVEETADERLKRIVRGLGTFAPQLAYPKQFDRRHAESLVPSVPCDAESLWRHVLAATAREAA